MPKIRRRLRSRRPSTCDLDDKNIIGSMRSRRGPRRSSRRASIKADFSSLFVDKTTEFVEMTDLSSNVTKEIKRLGGMFWKDKRRGYDFDDGFHILPRNIQLLCDVEWKRFMTHFFYHADTNCEFEFTNEFRLQDEDLSKFSNFFKDKEVDDYYFVTCGDLYSVINWKTQKGSKDPEIIGLDAEKGNEVVRCNLSRFMKGLKLNKRPN